MAMEFLSTGLSRAQQYANPRQDTMASLPAPQQNAPALTAGTAPVSPRGIVVRGGAGVAGFGNDSLFYGRMSLGFVASLVVVLVLAYMWTRNVQGGG